ncbi:MAG: hypothetical protein ABSA02_16200 [Trebonia sp.]|jgi:hypothetical protein
MIMPSQPASRAFAVPWSVLSWRGAAALVATAAGAVMVTGALLPWIEEPAGIAAISGVRDTNGRIVALAGIVVIAAGIWQLAGSGGAGRWLAGLAGLAAAVFSGYLLFQATKTGVVGSPALLARGGPGLPVALAGSAAAFATTLFPRSARQALRFF